MDKTTEEMVSKMARAEISAYDEKSKVAAEIDDLKKDMEELETTRYIVPFQGKTPDRHFYDPKPGENPYNAIDVCKSREALVRSNPPLEIVNETSVGEFTPFKWELHNQKLLTSSDQLMSESKRLRDESSQKWNVIRSITEVTQKSSTKGLDERIKQTLDAKELLKMQIEKSVAHLNSLIEMKVRLQTTLFTLELPEMNNKECLHIRRFRRSIDNTRDNVSLSLNKESKTLLTGRNLLSHALHEIEEAIARLKEIKRMLEHDWSDKQETMQIDHAAAKLQIQPNLAQFKGVSAALNEGASTLQTWQHRIYEHRTASEREIVHDFQLRGAADQALTEVSEDVLTIGAEVDANLNSSIGKIEKALKYLKEEDGKVRREIAEIELSIRSLRQELMNKENPLKVAQTRHWERSYRPGMDRCLDEPHFRLKNELEQLPINIATLRTKLGQSEETLEELHRQHETLGKNVLEREHALSLDSRCVLCRKKKPTQSSLKGLSAIL